MSDDVEETIDVDRNIQRIHEMLDAYNDLLLPEVWHEAPDDAVAARFNLQLGMQGNIRTRTMKAFPEAAYREIITSLG